MYVIQEFERLKKNEAYQYKVEWQASRLLSKVNYVVHTDAIKSYIVPDVLNVALFGMTAKEWRDANPELAENGNIRDYTDLLHLVILNNLENTNAEMILNNIPQQERLVSLNESARRQMRVLKDNKSIKDLELLQNQINNNEKILIENNQ